MTTIQVFIASSSRDTAHERLVVGDDVRKLNDQYEKLGYRVRLACWEDFAPEYRGTRKQSEYNNHLIANSQIFVALFRSVCGQYTQEEVRYWRDLGMEPFVFDIQDTTADKTEVNNFITSIGLNTIPVQTDEDIVVQVSRIVGDFIRDHPTDIAMDNAPVKNVYATIPDDRKENWLLLSQIVRCLDDLAERHLHMRCSLTTHDIDKVASCDYYTAILKNHLDHDEEAEILSALQHSIAHHRPDIALYYNYDDKVVGNHPDVGKAISIAGLFNEPFDGMQRVRYNLLKWILNQSVLRIDLSAGISVKEGWFFFYGLPVIPLSKIGISADGEMQTAALIKKLSFDFLNADGGHWDGKGGNLDLKTIDTELIKTEEIVNAAKEMEQMAVMRKERILNIIKSEIDATLSSDVNCDNIVRLKNLIERKESLQIELLAEPREILRTQMLMVQVHDTYADQFMVTGIDINKQYLKVAETADRYGIVDPTVEMMRMNYANYLSRQNMNREAIKMYEKVMERLDSLDDRSELYRYYIIHLYVTYINHLIFLAENEQALYIITILENKIEKWNKYELSDAERTANDCRLMACKLRMRPFQEGLVELLRKAKDLYQNALSFPEDAFDQSIHDEIYCDLPICIASALMDALQAGIKMNKNQAGQDIMTCLENVITHTEHYPNDLSCLTYRGNALHNLGFFCSNIVGDQIKARYYCDKALAVRQKIFDVTHYPNVLYDVAQTLLLFGASYINGWRSPLTKTEYENALACADRCLAIYRELDNEHYLEQDTRYYEALQLKGSILYIWEGSEKTNGLVLLKQVWDWDLDHPENSYHDTFQNVAGLILKKEGWI